MTALEALVRGEAPALDGLLRQELRLEVARGRIECRLRRLSREIDAALEQDVPTRLRLVDPGDDVRRPQETRRGEAGPSPYLEVARGPWPPLVHNRRRT